MIKKVFVGSDIILDVATGRMPFVEHSKNVLAQIENGKILGFISSNSVTNIYYILRKISTSKKAKVFIEEIVKYLTVLPVTHANIVEALTLDFNDFEDAVQHQCACSSQCECIITRNGQDYKKSKIEAYSPEEFVALLGK